MLWDGNMRFCSFLDKPDIPVREMPFREAWGKLFEYEEALEWPEECKSCEAAKVCARCAATVALQPPGSPGCQAIREYARQLSHQNI